VETAWFEENIVCENFPYAAAEHRRNERIKSEEVSEVTLVTETPLFEHPARGYKLREFRSSRSFREAQGIPALRGQRDRVPFLSLNSQAVRLVRFLWASKENEQQSYWKRKRKIRFDSFFFIESVKNQ